MKKTYQISNISDYQEFILDFSPELKNGCLVLLEGDLGAGKTTLVSQILKHFQMNMVASPTYAFHHRYQSELITFDHFDLYRLESADDVESIGLWDLIQDNQTGAIFIEWPSRIPSEDWPLDRKLIQIQITINSDKNRILTVETK